MPIAVAKAVKIAMTLTPKSFNYKSFFVRLDSRGELGGEWTRSGANVFEEEEEEGAELDIEPNGSTPITCKPAFRATVACWAAATISAIKFRGRFGMYEGMGRRGGTSGVAGVTGGEGSSTSGLGTSAKQISVANRG